MKKISLSIIAIAMACASVMAAGTPVKHAKKAKQETACCCKDGKCTDTSCCSESACCAKN
ncbi:MAG: hypothetical protein V4577_27975 [Bacteroidota bacterium]